MKYEAVEIFPTVVYVGNMQNHEQNKQIFLNNYHQYDLVNSKVVSEPDGNPLLHLDEKFNGIFEEISSHLKAYVFDVLQVKEVFDLFITKTWISKATNFDNVIPWHIHTPCHISFIYYINYPVNSQKLFFNNKEKPNELFPGMSAINNMPEANFIKQFNEYNCRTVDFTFSEGTLVAFPSSLSHSTANADENFDGLRLAIVGDAILILKENELNNYNSFIHQKYWKQY